MHYYYDNGYEYGCGMGMFGGGWMIIIWIILIVLIVRLAREFTGKKSNRREESLEILRERYAKGEIDRKEFEEKKKVLES